MAESNAAKRRAEQNRARETAAAMRAQQQAAERRRKAIVAGAVVVAVIVVAVGIIALGANHTKKKNAAIPVRQPLPAGVLTDVTGVPQSTLDAIGVGTASTVNSPSSGVFSVPASVKPARPMLTAGGKPQIIYLGAEYCPYCAAQRWSVVQALSRFGTFTGLQATQSSSTDVYPNTHTLSFYGSSYSSPYIVFTTIEQQDRLKNTLENVPAAVQDRVNLWDTNGYIPFMDFADQFTLNGAGYSPQVLAGKTWNQIASAMQDPTSPIAKAADGNANLLTAAVCRITHNRPMNVCSSKAVILASPYIK